MVWGTSITKISKSERSEDRPQADSDGEHDRPAADALAALVQVSNKEKVGFP